LSSAKEQDPVRSLAERIAGRLAQDGGRESSASPERRDNTAANVGDELAALRAGLSEIGQRLTQIESHVTTSTPRQSERPARQHEHQHEHRHEHHAPNRQATPDAHARQPDHATAQTNNNPAHWLSGTYVPAVHPSEERFGIDEAVSELVEFFEREKVCNVEPGGKPCDHCGMCSSRGF
jgi:sulfite reductase alpha subunit-like flavoprotein